ncbi:hypothetical protein HMPREF1548_02394 [Clostridium sp. KLE 1755]|nr:hypothetical protein HMPREF1548_02394 [Clostridium sp. KLE 1755]
MNVPDVTYLERTIGFLYTGLYRVKNGNRQVCAFTAQTVEKRGASGIRPTAQRLIGRKR